MCDNFSKKFAFNVSKKVSIESMWLIFEQRGIF